MYIVTTYAVITIYAAVLILAMINFLQFIVRGNKKLSPLLFFYVLVIACLISDIAYAVTLIEQEVNPMALITFLPPTFKVAIGIE